MPSKKSSTTKPVQEDVVVTQPVTPPTESSSAMDMESAPAVAVEASVAAEAKPAKVTAPRKKTPPASSTPMTSVEDGEAKDAEAKTASDTKPPASEKKKNKRAAKSSTDGEKVKRACSSYIIFTKSNRTKVKEECPDLGSTQIISELAKRWNALSIEDKEPYNRMHEEEKAALAAAQAEAKN